MTPFARWLVPAAMMALPCALRAEALLPIVDAHLHYSQSAWSAYPPDQVLRLMDQAGVSRAFASSTPDDGTLRLYQAAPARIVPFLRPYRGEVGSGNWFEDATLLPYLEGRLKSGVYRGIGEFHLSGSAAQFPIVKRVAALAASRGLFVHVHSGAGPVRDLLALEPRLRILWAHAGMSEPPSVVGALLDSSDRVWTEVSFRAEEIAPGNRMDPGWLAVFQRHPTRVLIGTDTYITERWASYPELIAAHRHWLGLLPAGLAQAIAHQNAARLLGEP